ncbi:TIGR03619 family F420-dependent LLM class oxidoreductase [Nocardia abscessus]|uniref:TIGR03619 family F420-dependent LLM class oxidoreductase n=1 Tax=Nocardia abscessus TaxID=120957 RepID=UPI002454FB1E|nr:TIGR03619 family F420-dependent LLM class oxidoreductase [Nocardia abscessus]
MKYSLSLSYTTPREVINMAQAAESSGFFGIAMGEHLFHPVDIASDYPYKPTPDGPRSIDHKAPLLNLWTTAGAIIGSTKNLHFMTSVYLLVLRHPLVSANAAATLAGISNNRFEFGVGLGWMREEYEELGVPWQGRGKRFDEALDIMERAWNGVSEPHDGEHYSFKAMGTNPLPPAPVPLYFGGHSEPAMRRAVDRGRGWICAPRPDLAKEQVRTITEMRTVSGKEGSPFEFCAMVKQPDAALIGELTDIGIGHFIVSSPWRPDLANQTDPDEKLAALIDMGEGLRKIGASL